MMIMKGKGLRVGIIYASLMIISMFFLVGVLGEMELKVYRLIQYQQEQESVEGEGEGKGGSEKIMFGSQRVQMKGQALFLGFTKEGGVMTFIEGENPIDFILPEDESQFQSQVQSSSSLSSFSSKSSRLNILERKILTIPFELITIELIDLLFDGQIRLAGLLVVMPRNLTSIDNHILERWKLIENKLIHMNNIVIPIYFVEYDESFMKYVQLNQHHKGSKILDDKISFLVKGREARPIKVDSITNLQAWIPGSSKKGYTHVLPTIVLCAYVDTVSILPGFVTGVDSNASGAIALVELVRLFSKLYSFSKTQGNYNMLFFLSGGGSQNFEGTGLWLDRISPVIRDSIELAICLDTIGNSNELNLHFSRPIKDQSVQKIFEVFSSVSEDLDINLDVVHKKINISNPHVAWQHEQFSRNHILASTLSHLYSPPENFQRTSIFDDRNSFTMNSLKMSIKLVGEALSQIIFNTSGVPINVFEDSNSIDEMYVQAWIDTMSSQSRFFPLITKDSEIISALYQAFNEYATDVSLEKVPFSSKILYYESTTATLMVYHSKSIAFEMFLLMLVGVYIFSIYSLIQGPKEVYSQLKNLLRTKKKKA